MADGIPTPEGAVLRFHRFSKGVSEEDLASMVGVTPHTIGRWENGDLPLARERLAEILDRHLGVSREAMDEALYAHHLGNLPHEPASMAALPEAERRLIGQAAVAGGRAGSEAARRELTIERLRRRAARHASWAAGVWSKPQGSPRQAPERRGAGAPGGRAELGPGRPALRGQHGRRGAQRERVPALGAPCREPRW